MLTSASSGFGAMTAQALVDAANRRITDALDTKDTEPEGAAS
jgi:NADP-dependent 3-hydroxy acid dehydrogenase YdfG